MWKVLDGIREGMHEYTKAPIEGRTLHPWVFDIVRAGARARQYGASLSSRQYCLDNCEDL